METNAINKFMNKITTTKLYAIMATVLFPLILLLYPFWNVTIGVDVADTAYSLANYTYIEQLDKMWFFSTFIANVAGVFFTHLPGGDKMLGINIYTTCLISFLALTSYYFFVKKIPAWLVFIGEFMAISLAWCPSVILYNYLTYVFFLLACILVYQGVTKEKNSRLFFAGVLLGVNLFVRFPNIAEVALIVVVWYSGWIQKKKFTNTLYQTLFCLLGYIAGVAAVFSIISLQFGAGNYIDSIKELFTMTSSATAYTPFAMILAIFTGYKEGLSWVAKIFIFGVMGMGIFSIIPKRFRIYGEILYGILLVVFLKWLYGQGMYDFNYQYYFSIYNWSTFFIIVALIYIVYLNFSKNTSVESKTLSVVILVIIGITPLGSNNQLYPNINNMFLIAPFTLYGIYSFIAAGFDKYEKSSIDAFRLLAILFISAFIFQSTVFGLRYVYNQGYSQEKRDTKIENNDIINNMRTTKVVGSSLQELNDFIEVTQLTGHSVILMGNIPGLSYYFQMPFAISTPWPDLPSFSYEKFKEEIDGLEETPLIIVTKELADWILEKDDLSSELKEKYNNNKKYLVLKEYVKEKKYTIIYSNDTYGVFQEAETND